MYTYLNRRYNLSAISTNAAVRSRSVLNTAQIQSASTIKHKSFSICISPFPLILHSHLLLALQKTLRNSSSSIHFPHVLVLPAPKGTVLLLYHTNSLKSLLLITNLYRIFSSFFIKPTRQISTIIKPQTHTSSHPKVPPQTGIRPSRTVSSVPALSRYALPDTAPWRRGPSWLP